MDYIRPDLNDEDKKQAQQAATTLLRKYGYANFAQILAALCLENVRLVKEINEHREARGIALLEVHEV